MKRRGIILVLLCGVVGCNARQTSTTTNAVAPVAAVFANQGEWVSSQDKSLSLRVSTDKATYRVGEAVRIQIEVRNKSQEAIRLPSLEDEAFPWITGPKEIKYIGPQVDRTPEPEIVLNPGVSGTREVVISGENWGRLDLPGKYVAHFLYQGPSSGIYQGLEPSVGFSVEKEQPRSPLVANEVSVSVAGYFTTNINGRTAVRATIKMTNQSARSIWTDGFPPAYEEEVWEAGQWKLRPIQWGATPRRELTPGASLEFSVPVQAADPPKRLMLMFHRHPSIESKDVSFIVYSPPIEFPQKP